MYIYTICRLTRIKRQRFSTTLCLSTYNLLLQLLLVLSCTYNPRSNSYSISTSSGSGKRTMASTMTGMALDCRQHRIPPGIFQQQQVSPLFLWTHDSSFTVSPTVTRSNIVYSLMTASTAWSPTVQSENTAMKHGYNFTTEGFWQLSVVSPIFPRISDSSSTVSPTVTRSDTVYSLMTASTAQSPIV